MVMPHIMPADGPIIGDVGILDMGPIIGAVAELLIMLMALSLRPDPQLDIGLMVDPIIIPGMLSGDTAIMGATLELLMSPIILLPVLAHSVAHAIGKKRLWHVQLDMHVFEVIYKGTTCLDDS